MKRPSAAVAVDGKITPVKRKDRIDLFAMREIN
jgi:hypothetical protein